LIKITIVKSFKKAILQQKFGLGIISTLKSALLYAWNINLYL